MHQRIPGVLLRRRSPSPGCYALGRGIRSFPGIASVSSPGAELSALPDAHTDGSIFISASTTIGIVPTMPSSSIRSSSAGLLDPFSTARRLAAQHGLKMERHLTQRCKFQPSQSRRIHRRIRTLQTRHCIPAVAPRHHRTA